MQETNTPTRMADIERELGGRSGRSDDHDHDVGIDWRLLENGIEITISGMNDIGRRAKLRGRIEFEDRDHAIEIVEDLTEAAAAVHEERMEYAMSSGDGPLEITHGTAETFGWWVFGFSAEELARADEEEDYELEGSHWHICEDGFFVEEVWEEQVTQTT